MTGPGPAIRPADRTPLVRTLVLALLVGLAATPALAIDLSPVTTQICSVVTALTGPLGRAAGVLAIIAVGIIWWYGRMNIPLAVTILMGAAVVFGAPTILEGIAGGRGCA